MPTSVHPNPVMKSLSLSSTNAVNLRAALVAAFPTVTIPTQCAQLRIRLDVNAPGDLYVGNDDVSATNNGEHLVQGQYTDSFARDSNDFPLQDIWIKPASASATIIGITILAK